MSDYDITLSNHSPVIGTAAHQLKEIIFPARQAHAGTEMLYA
jgi:hypothetical protein